MAPIETNHGSGDVGARPNPPEQHQPAAQEAEQYPGSISLPQTPETAQRAVVLNDSDHPGIGIDNTALADFANGAPGPHIPFMYSPPRPEARLTPPPPTGLGPTPAWNLRWFHDQGQSGPAIGLGLTLYPPGAPGAASERVAPPPERRSADGWVEQPAGDEKDAATCGDQASSSRK